jgi:hypothetical protein
VNLKDFGKDAKGVVAAIAPALGAALGGPLGGMAGKVISAALGTTDAKAAAAAIMAGDPETMLKLKTAELTFQQHLADLGVTEDQIAAEDRKSARDLQIATKSFLVPSLAVIIVASFVTMVGTTLLGYSHVEGALAGTLVGYLSAKCEQVLSFYFGSSAGSERKTELMAAGK